MLLKKKLQELKLDINTNKDIKERHSRHKGYRGSELLPKSSWSIRRSNIKVTGPGVSTQCVREVSNQLNVKI
jgi:hypothetical protein